MHQRCSSKAASRLGGLSRAMRLQRQTLKCDTAWPSWYRLKRFAHRYPIVDRCRIRAAGEVQTAAQRHRQDKVHSAKAALAAQKLPKFDVLNVDQRPFRRRHALHRRALTSVGNSVSSVILTIVVDYLSIDPNT